MENITKSFHENYTSLYSNYQALDKKNSEKCINLYRNYGQKYIVDIHEAIHGSDSGPGHL